MKTPIKYIIIFIITAVICTVFSTYAFAKVYSGEQASYSWSIDLNNGHMKLTGTGDIPHYANYTLVPYSKFLPLIKTLEIGDGITSIGSCAFMYAYNLESVSLPDTIVSIGESAFEACTKLESINFPESLTSIGNTAFSDCKKLDGITLPSNLEVLGDYAFCQCSSLSSINIPSGISEIPPGAFSGCKALSGITGLDNVTVLSEASFYGCEALNFDEFPQSIDTISARAFFGCKSFTGLVPQYVTAHSGAFYNSHAMFSVIWNIDGKSETSKVEVNQKPQYNGTPKKDAVLEGIYLFNGWDKEIVSAVVAQNSYTAMFCLAKPITSASYTQSSQALNVSAKLNLSGIGTDNAYILFACYSENGSMISSKRVPVTKNDLTAEAVLQLRGRTVALVKAFIYTDKACITPLGESVIAKLN